MCDWCARTRRIRDDVAEIAARPHDPTADRNGLPERLATLLDCARSGDQQAFGEIVRELTPLLWHVARARGLDREDAADAVQAAWLCLLGSMQKIRDPAALRGWLITVTQREAWRLRTAIDRAGYPTADGLPDLAAHDLDPDQRVLDEEKRRCLWDNLHRLSPRCQELLRVVAFVERPDYTSVAGALGMPRGSIGPTRGRCLAKLRASLIDDPRWSQ